MLSSLSRGQWDGEGKRSGERKEEVTYSEGKLRIYRFMKHGLFEMSVSAVS